MWLLMTHCINICYFVHVIKALCVQYINKNVVDKDQNRVKRTVSFTCRLIIRCKK